MKKVNVFNIAVLGLLLTGLAVMNGCKKETALTIPDELAHFMNQTGGSYFVTAPGVKDTITVGVTTVSGSDRTVNILVTSPTGAVQGTHYTLNTTSLVIPAGKATADIIVTADYNAYTGGRKDTLIFSIQEPGVKSSSYNPTYRLFMRGPCFEGEIATELQSLVGAYANTIERGYTNTTGALSYTYGPYTTTITSATLTSPTTATISVANLYDASPPWNNVTFTLDWTNINDRRVTLTQQVVGDAGQINAAYTGMELTVNPLATANPAPTYGTFSYCNSTFRLKLRMCVPALGGCFNTQLIFDLAR